MPWSILNRYILLELVRVFLLALVAITGILVMAGVVAEASQQGLGPAQILQLLPYLIPGTLPFTVPATTLFAVSVVYGRLAHDNEITAIKAAGIPIRRVLWPAVLVGATLSGLLLGLYGYFIPRTHNRMKTMVLRDVEELIYAVLRKDLCFNQPGVNYAIWVEKVQGRRLINPTFKRRDNQGRDEVIVHAREAEIHVDMEQQVVIVTMLHGEILKPGGDKEAYGIFDKESFPVPLPPIGAARRIRPREMTNDELLTRRAEVVQEREELLAHMKAGLETPANPPPQPKSQHEVLLDLKLRYLEQEVWAIDTEYAMRPAMAASCLFFVLIGCPVGIWFHKRDYLSAFVTCFLPIVVLYYPLMMMGMNLGKEGKFNPYYSMWLGNGVLGLTGLILFWRLSRR